MVIFLELKTMVALFRAGSQTVIHAKKIFIIILKIPRTHD